MAQNFYQSHSRLGASATIFMVASIQVFLLLSALTPSSGLSVRKIISTDKAPGSSLPLNQAVQVDDMLYVSGTLGMDLNGTLVPGIVNQCRQTLDNIGHILEAGGSSFRSVVKVNVLLADMAYYDVMNLVYAEYFTEKFPARFAYQVARLPRDALVEIDAIAIVGEVVDVDID